MALLPVVLLAEFAVAALDDFQPLLLALAAGEVVLLAVVEVLAVVGVGVEGVLVVDELVGQVLVDRVQPLPLAEDIERPPPLDLEEVLADLLGRRRDLLGGET